MKVTKTHVYFWGGIFSNFYPCGIYYNGIKFLSSEQLFMYLKAMAFEDKKIANLIIKTSDPKEAKKLGRKISNFKDYEWEEIREGVMYTAVYEKFSQNEVLCDSLLKYSNKTFVEASPFDRIWGVGLREDDPAILNEENWNGLNLLGKILNTVAYEVI